MLEHALDILVYKLKESTVFLLKRMGSFASLFKFGV